MSVCFDVTAGRESGAGEQLSAFDLDDGEWTAFSEGIARLATEQVQMPRLTLAQ